MKFYKETKNTISYELQATMHNKYELWKQKDKAVWIIVNPKGNIHKIVEDFTKAWAEFSITVFEK